MPGGEWLPGVVTDCYRTTTVQMHFVRLDSGRMMTCASPACIRARDQK
jgi:hypothetical protein